MSDEAPDSAASTARGLGTFWPEVIVAAGLMLLAAESGASSLMNISSAGLCGRGALHRTGKARSPGQLAMKPASFISTRCICSFLPSH